MIGKFIKLLLFIIVIINVIFVLNYYFFYKRKLNQIQKVATERISYLEYLWGEGLRNSGNLRVKREISFIDENQNKVNSNDLFKRSSSPFLIFRISHTFCNSCLDEEMPKLLRFSKVIGSDNIIILTTKINFDEIYRYNKFKNIPFKIYYTNTSDILENNLDDQTAFPYTFIMDTTGAVKFFYEVSSGYPQLTDKYFDILRDFLYKSRNSYNLNTTVKTAAIKFSTLEHNFGILKHDAIANYSFRFKNISRFPLFITSVASDCGCTTPTYPLNVINPYDSATIIVSYDTKKIGEFNKNVFVYSNAKESPSVLNVRGRVE